MRLAAESAPESVVAVVYFLPSQFAFDGDAVRLPVCEAHILACKAAYRGRGGAENNKYHECTFRNGECAGTRCGLRVHGHGTGRYPGLLPHPRLRIPSTWARARHAHFCAQPIKCARRCAIPVLPPTDNRQPTTTSPRLSASSLAPHAKAEMFTDAKDSATLTAWLCYLLGDRSAAHISPAYSVDPFFVLEKRDAPNGPPRVFAAAGLCLSKSGGPTAVVHPLLWDDVSVVHPEGSPNKLASLLWTLLDAHPLYRWILAHEFPTDTTKSRSTASLRSCVASWTSPPRAPRTLSPPTPYYVLEEKRDTEAPLRVVAAAGLRRYELSAETAVVEPHGGHTLPTADGSPNKLASLWWILPAMGPLRQRLLAHELAVPPKGSSQYEFVDYHHSLLRFLDALPPVLNLRLAASAHLFGTGTNYTTELQIVALRAMGGGVVPHIADGMVSVKLATVKQDIIMSSLLP
ncbi:hypothetical protein MVEN_01844300 [Mycena venus]|uniref:Uncharacterized protein n=1 Tax=Mycena venus TaxID=2733690 RepID=A0A8H6XIG6_9AGAR|nr:hypothetical protein MVEN_01844300 [Mycena venus]